MTPFAATHALRRLANDGILVYLKRGVWANQLFEDLDPLEAIPHLTAPWASYVSLYSALSRQGIIEEVPQASYGVTAGRPQKLTTPLGTFHIHHLPGHLIWGFNREPVGHAVLFMAEPEKALLDLAYLGLIPRSPLGLPYKRDRRWRLDPDKLAKYAKRFHYPPLIKYLR